MWLQKAIEVAHKIIKRFKPMFVLVLFGSGLFLLASGASNEIDCSWDGFTCNGATVSIWMINPIKITLGGVLVVASFLLYMSKDDS
jgi:hypothetical protein